MATTRSTCARSFISGSVKATVWRRGTGKAMMYDERPVPSELAHHAKQKLAEASPLPDLPKGQLHDGRDVRPAAIAGIQACGS
jgi:hypothetical protein